MEKYEFFEKFNTALNEKISIQATENQLEKFYCFMIMLINTNKDINLTAITDPEEIIYKHFIDSLEAMKIDNLFESGENNISVVDVGSGAGFPGIPLAIMNENVKFLLIDSLNKRIKFLEKVIDENNINNVVVKHMRAEDINIDDVYREKFSLAISRGVTKINTLSEYMLPYVKKKGKIIMYKMSDCQKEFDEGKNAIKILGAQFLEKYEYKLFHEEPKRCLLVYEKIKNTDKKYPRQGNKPKTQPL